jgi:hypothetical protein
MVAITPSDGNNLTGRFLGLFQGASLIVKED